MTEVIASIKDIKEIRTQEEFDLALELMQKDYYIINAKGRVAVLNIDNGKELVFTEESGFKLFFKHLSITKPIGNGSKFKTEYLADHFFNSGKTIRLDRIDFDPRCPPGINGRWYNVWKGFKYKPVKGCVHDFLTLLDVNCGGDVDAFEYFLKYVALSVQKPWVNPRTAICIIGDPGAGKGRLINDTILKLTDNSIPLNSLKEITGDFNSSLRDVLYVCLDECSFGGDIREANLLKTLISEDKRIINEKYMKPYVVNAFSKVFILSNNDYIVNVEQGDRRYCVLRASSKLIDTEHWFKNYDVWLKNGGYEAIMYYLMYEVDVSDFNPLKIPATKEKAELKLRSADLATKFIFELLEGNIQFGDDLVRNNRIYREPLQEAFKDYCRTYHSKSYMPSPRDLQKALNKAFNFKQDNENWERNWKEGKKYYYLMPSLEEFQKRFTKNVLGLDDYRQIFTNQATPTPKDPIEVLDNIFEKA